MTDTTPPETPHWTPVPSVPERVRDAGIGMIVARLIERVEELTAAVEALGGTPPEGGDDGEQATTPDPA